MRWESFIQSRYSPRFHLVGKPRKLPQISIISRPVLSKFNSTAQLPPHFPNKKSETSQQLCNNSNVYSNPSPLPPFWRSSPFHFHSPHIFQVTKSYSAAEISLVSLHPTGLHGFLRKQSHNATPPSHRAMTRPRAHRRRILSLPTSYDCCSRGAGRSAGGACEE